MTNNSNYNYKIAVTIGDINGIGLEVFIKSIISLKSENQNNTNYTLFFDKTIFLNYLKKSNLITDILLHFQDNYKNKIENNGILKFVSILSLFNANPSLHLDKFLTFFNLEIIDVFELNNIKRDVYNQLPTFSEVSKISGELAHFSFLEATKEVIKGNYDILLTLPIAKEAVYLANWNYPGHTEYISAIINEMNLDSTNNTENPIMIISTKEGKVALATVHIPLRKVADSLSVELICEKFKAFYNSLKFDYNLENPRIAILGLNPHAGENGELGSEENDIINKAIELMSNDNSLSKAIDYQTAFPADGFFAHKLYKKYTGVLAMYHDQGLIPFKMLADGGGVNFTANQLIVRTSPDHGTAFAIAGKNIANPQSTIDAILEGIEIFKNRSKL